MRARWQSLIDCTMRSVHAALQLLNTRIRPEHNRGESFFAAEGRWGQMQAILAHIAAWREAHPDAALLVVGDFNSLANLGDPWARERTIVEMHRRYDSAISEYTPTHLLQYQLDWIFYERLQLQEASVVDLVRSDHYPVVAEFVVGPRPAPSDVAEVTSDP